MKRTDFSLIKKITLVSSIALGGALGHYYFVSKKQPAVIQEFDYNQDAQNLDFHLLVVIK